MKARLFRGKKAALCRTSNESSGNGEKFVLTLDWHIPQYRLGTNANCMMAEIHVQIHLENGEEGD